MGILPVAAEGKLDDLHSRIAGLLQELLHCRHEDAQVLGDDLCAIVLDGLIDGVGQLLARSLSPVAVHRRLLPVGDGEILGNADEMVDADHVIERRIALHPLRPPDKAVLYHLGPVVQRVSPELSRLGKSIGRNTRHLRRKLGLPVQLELLLAAPHIRAVKGHIQRNIADDGDSSLIGVIPDLLPLLPELELDKLPVINLLGQLLPHPGQRLRLSSADILFPVHPARFLMAFLQGHIHGIVIQPVDILRRKLPVFRELPVLTAGKCELKQRKTPVVQTSVIHPVRLLTPGILIDLLLFQELLFLQHVQVDKVGIPRKCRIGRIGAVPIARRSHGKHLPVLLLRPHQGIDKLIGRLPETADAVGRRQGRHRHQDASSSLKHCLCHVF